MNKLSIKFTALISLLMSGALAHASVFDIEPINTISEIADDAFAVVTYEVEYKSSDPDEFRGMEIGGPEDDGRLQHGVKQICGEHGSWCVQSCGDRTLPADPADPSICQVKTDFNYYDENKNSCTLMLCIDGEDVAENEHHKVEGGPYACGERETPGTCSKPISSAELNITAIPAADLLRISIVKPYGREHLAILHPGIPFDFVLRNDSTTQTALYIEPTFTADTLAQLDSFDDSDCDSVGPLQECKVVVTAKHNAVTLPIQPVFFQGTNTNRVEGHIAIERNHALKLETGHLVFDEPGTKDLRVKNTTDQIIRISDIRFRGVHGVKAEHSSDINDCRYVSGAWVVQPNSGCGIDVLAEEDAYTTERHPGVVLLTYTVDHSGLKQIAKGFVVVVPSIIEINDGKPIRLARDHEEVGVNSSETIFKVENEGKFVLHDLDLFVTPHSDEITFTSDCPDRLDPERDCEVRMSAVEILEADNEHEHFFVAKAKNGHAEERIIRDEVTVATAHDRFQHLKSQTIIVRNDRDIDDDPSKNDGNSLHLESVILNFGANTQNIAKWCKANDVSCAHRSTCRKDVPIRPGSACSIVVKVLDTVDDFSELKGEVTVNLVDSGETTQSLISTTFGALVSSNLYATGTFDSAGKFEANNIAQWNGFVWKTLDTGLNGTGRDLEIVADDLVVVGDFLNAGLQSETAKVARWNGVTWHRFGHTNPSVDGGIRALLPVDNSIVYFMGDFSTAGGKNTPNIAQWMPHKRNGWDSLGGIPDNGTAGPVDEAALFNNGVYFGGDFDDIHHQTSDFNFIAGWVDNTWRHLGTARRNGTNNEVLALLAEGDDLLVGGHFKRVFAPGRFWWGVKRAHHIARWDNSEQTWHHVASRRGDEKINGSVQDIIKFNNKTWIGGHFNGEFKYVASQEGKNWKQVGTGINGPVYDLYAHNGVAYAGGDFDGLISNPLNNIAAWNGSTWSPLADGLEDSTRDATVDSIIISPSIQLFGGK